MNEKDNQIEVKEENSGEEKKKRPRLFRWALTLIAIYIVVMLVAFFAGNKLGIQDRIQYEDQLAGTEIASQYQLALEDIEAERYQQAIMRLEYILKYEPESSLASDKLEQVQFIINFTATPTIEPTATLYPVRSIRTSSPLGRFFYLVG